MKNIKRILAAALVGVMIFSAMPVMILNAEETVDETEVQEEETREEAEDGISVETEDEATVETKEQDVEIEDGITSVDETSKLNYLYVSQSGLVVNEMQDIVVSWGDGTENVEKAELWYQINGEPAGYLSLENKGSGLFLYQNCFGEEGSYFFTCVRIVADGQEYDYYLEEIGINAVFEVYAENEDDIPGVAVIDAEDVENAQAEEMIAEALGEVAADSNVSIATYALERSSSDGEIVVAIDPGHDATHAGASGNGIKEEVATLKIAQYCKEELEKYAGVKVYMCRESAACPYPGTSSIRDIEERVRASVQQEADIYVSIHLNSANSSAAKGAEVWYPDSSQTPNTTPEGKALSEKVQAELVKLGLYNRGAQETDNNYACMREGGKYGLPAIIIEHAFVSNASDASNYLSSDAKLKKLGVADANGIVAHYGLKLK
ncbi:MAG: N-acetylmuramoyl-L-alanine amidase, partial [bacterium]|nr:N-acetylmuramoyl-L-alanine amidase [bacterium]